MYDPLIGTATEMKFRIAQLRYKRSVHQSIYIWKYLPETLVSLDFLDQLQRITGYLVGTTSRWNGGKLAELRDRVVHE